MFKSFVLCHIFPDNAKYWLSLNILFLLYLDMKMSLEKITYLCRLWCSESHLVNMNYLKVILSSYLSPCELFQIFTNVFKSLILLPLLLQKVNIILAEIVAISQIPSISCPNLLM